MYFSPASSLSKFDSKQPLSQELSTVIKLLHLYSDTFLHTCKITVIRQFFIRLNFAFKIFVLKFFHEEKFKM